MSENRDAVVGVAIVSVCTVSIFVGIYNVAREAAWTDGYCTALGGQRLDRYTCEVDGRVVRPEDPRPASAALPMCEEEDGSSGPIPCRWDASVAGNGVGVSFTITEPGVFVYDDGHVERDAS